MLLENVVLLARTREASWYGPYRHVPVVRLRRAVESWIDSARRGTLPEYRLREWRHCVAAAARCARDVNAASASAASALLEELCQLFFTSFEATVTLLFGAPASTQTRSRWFPIMRSVAKELGCWRGLPHCISASRIGMAALCRIAAAEWVARCWITGQDDAWVDYPAQLFIDTHLDLLAAAARYAVADDAWWFATSTGDSRDCRLLSVYPLPHRVVCVEELPDLVPYLVRADLLHDYGRNKKQATLGKALTHLFLCKMMNQICHIRHLGKKTEDYIKAHPTVIGPLVRLVLHVGLLGNLPNQQSRLRLAARVRVHLDFVPDPFGPVPGEAALTLERMIRWIYQHAHTALFLMRSYCIYTCEQDVAIDRMLGGPYKWSDFKRIVCRATGLVRTQLSEQVLRGFAAPINWAPIEIGEVRLRREGWSSTDITQLQLDRINVMHQAALSASRKVLKGRVETMLPRKMTPTRRDVLGAHLHKLVLDNVHGVGRAYHELMHGVENEGRSVFDYPMHLRRDFSLLVQMATKRPPERTLREVFVEYLVDAEVIPSLKPQLDAAAAPLYVASWAAAQATLEPNASARDQQVMPLRFLEFLPLPPDHITRIRAWVYEYHVLDHSDNGYQRYATLLGQESLQSHILVHLFFRWIHWHRRSPPILLPIEHSQRQLQALRDRNGLLPYQTTPEHLGRGLFCPCCGRWSTPVVDAPPWIVAHADWMGSKQDWEEDARDREQRQRHEDAAAASHGKKRKKKRRRRRFIMKTTTPGAVATLITDLHLSPLARQIARLPAPAASPNNFAIDVRTGDPYCMRGKRCGKDPVLSALRNGDFYAHDVLERMRVATQSNEDLLNRKRQARFGMSVTGAAARMPAIVEEDEEEEEEEEDAALSEEEDDYDDGDDADEGVEREVDIADVLVRAMDAGHDFTPALLMRLPSVSTAPAAPRKKKTVWSTKLTERTFHRLTERLRQHAHAGAELAATCWAEPLYTVDLVGVWWRHRGKTLVGLCCYCGVITLVRDAAMTRKGLSCMHHAEHADEWPVDSPQSMAFRAPPAKGDADAAESLLEQVRRRELYKNPWRLRTPVPCAYCRQQATSSVVFAFDLHLRIYEVPLCIVELGRLHLQFPGVQLVRNHNCAGIEMLPLHLLWNELQSSHAAALRRKDAQTLRSALRDTNGSHNDLLLSERSREEEEEDDEDLFLELEEAAAPVLPQVLTGTTVEQIKAHPHLQQLLRDDPHAAIDFRFNLERPAAAQKLRQKLRDLSGF